MLKEFAAGIALVILAGTPASADTLSGKIVSLDVNVRQLTLETGETFNLLESVAVDQLTVDQVVNVVSADGTIDAISVDVLQDAPVASDSGVSDESTSNSIATPPNDTTATGSDVTTQDSSVPVLNTSSDSSTESSTSSNATATTDQNTSDTASEVDPTSSEDNQSAGDTDTATVTDGTSVDYTSSTPQ